MGFQCYGYRGDELAPEDPEDAVLIPLAEVQAAVAARPGLSMRQERDTWWISVDDHPEPGDGIGFWFIKGSLDLTPQDDPHLAAFVHFCAALDAKVTDDDGNLFFPSDEPPGYRYLEWDEREDLPPEPEPTPQEVRQQEQWKREKEELTRSALEDWEEIRSPSPLARVGRVAVPILGLGFAIWAVLAFAAAVEEAGRPARPEPPFPGAGLGPDARYTLEIALQSAEEPAADGRRLAHASNSGRVVDGFRPWGATGAMLWLEEGGAFTPGPATLSCWYDEPANEENCAVP